MHPQIRERLNLAHAMGSTDFTDSTDGTALDRCLKRERAGRKSWRLKPAFGIKFGSGDVTHLPALRALRRGARLSPWRDEGLTPRRKGATCSRPASTPLPPHPPLWIIPGLRFHWIPRMNTDTACRIWSHTSNGFLTRSTRARHLPRGPISRSQLHTPRRPQSNQRWRIHFDNTTRPSCHSSV